jgi:quercetin dioxygenase-like cupin family protein
MIIKKMLEVKPVQELPKVQKRVVIGEEDGAPNYIMRVFDLEPGGSTAFHTHESEHEIYVLSGKGVAVRENGETPIAKDSVVFVPPSEKHCFKNNSNELLRVICVIPKG